jgi:hypothetical protein
VNPEPAIRKLPTIVADAFTVTERGRYVIVSDGLEPCVPGFD